MNEGPAATSPWPRSWRVVLLAVVSIVLTLLVLRHQPGLDGPWYSRWGWRQTSGWRIYPALLAAFAPLILAHALYARQRIGERGAIALSMISLLAMQLVYASLLGGTFSFKPFIELVQHPMALSYFMDAGGLMSGPGGVRDWLTHYPELMPQMFLHSQEKPPGLVLYFALFIKLFGLNDTAALIGGVIAMTLSTLSVPAVYALARTLGGARDAAVTACMLLVLSPSMTLFFPSLDACYPIFTCAVLICWIIALTRNRFVWSIAFGMVLALMMFVAYNLLVLGAMIVAYALVCRAEPWPVRIGRFVRHSFIALTTVAIVYALLWLVSGFDPIATFQMAVKNQLKLAEQWRRPWPWTILFDLQDFALGAGWATCLLAAYFLALCDSAQPQDFRRSCWVGIGQVLLVATTGLLMAETARVWCFLVPLIALPAGAELARWSTRDRTIALLSAWLILAALAQNLIAPFGEIPPLIGQ